MTLLPQLAHNSSVLSFNSTNSRTICRNHHESRPTHGQVPAFSRIQLPSSMWMSNPHRLGKIFSLSDSDGDRVAVDTADKGPALPLDSVGRSTTQSNGPVPKLEAESDQPLSPKSPQTSAKRSPLTARERLRAARVLSRYSEAKPAAKLKMGSKVLDALKESDGGKRRSGLPEAPTNLFDDSKRGLPKAGLTFSFPGGFDLFVVAFSFVFISTVMFATTYLVWKVGAIHFNEY